MKNNEKTKDKDQINRGGAHRYEEGVRGNARSGASVKQARDAERALDGPERDALREAEREGNEAARHERR